MCKYNIMKNTVKVLGLGLVIGLSSCSKDEIFVEEDLFVEPDTTWRFEDGTPVDVQSNTQSETTVVVETYENTGIQVGTSSQQRFYGFETGSTYTNVIYNIWINDELTTNHQLIIDAVESILSSDNWGDSVKNQVMNGIQIIDNDDVVVEIGGGYANPGLNGEDRYSKYNGLGNGFDTDYDIDGIISIITHEQTHQANFDFNEDQWNTLNDYFAQAEESSIAQQIIDEHGYNGYYHGLVNSVEFLEYMSSVYVDDIEGIEYGSTQLDNELLASLDGLVEFMIETGIIQ